MKLIHRCCSRIRTVEQWMLHVTW